MRMSIRAGIAIALATVFSLYHLVLAVSSLDAVSRVAPVIACMVVYAAATGVALFVKGAVLPVWASCFALASSIAMPLMVAPQISSTATGYGYVTWYVAAIGTLMVVLVVRQRGAFAWFGIAFLTVHTIVVDGVGALGTLGVFGSLAWVAIATGFSVAMNRATRATREFVRAERAAADWEAAQHAHVHERQFRLARTARTASTMLERIIAADGDLGADERVECLHLEQALRDEIRGRSLLCDGVRDAVMTLRRAGSVVQLHDDGGLDDLEPAALDLVHEQLAAALGDALGADDVIVRTVQDTKSSSAVTVVGLRRMTGAEQVALGSAGEDDDEADSVVIWREIPRNIASAG